MENEKKYIIDEKTLNNIKIVLNILYTNKQSFLESIKIVNLINTFARLKEKDMDNGNKKEKKDKKNVK